MNLLGYVTGTRKIRALWEEIEAFITEIKAHDPSALASCERYPAGMFMDTKREVRELKARLKSLRSELSALRAGTP